MPELPEVQTIVNDLDHKISGMIIVDFSTDWAKAIKHPLDEFCGLVIGTKIQRVARRGKNLLFFLDNDQVMLVHLKMTGHLLVKSKVTSQKSTGEDFFQERVNQYIHHIWKLRHPSIKHGFDTTLEFSDLRKFAKIRIITQKALIKDTELSHLGIEPLAKEFTYSVLHDLLQQRPRLSLRTLLMDQSKIVGIGNIYVSEILFVARIHPERIVGQLTSAEQKLLYQAIRTILAKAVRMRGTSDADYRDTDGAPGHFQTMLMVYNREGAPCKRRGCSGIIQRKKIGQRSAYYCPLCQH